MLLDHTVPEYGMVGQDPRDVRNALRDLDYNTSSIIIHYLHYHHHPACQNLLLPSLLHLMQMLTNKCTFRELTCNVTVSLPII